MVLSFFICNESNPELRKDFDSQFDVEKEFNLLVEKLFKSDKEHLYNAFNFLLKQRVILRSAHCCQEDSADEPNIDGNSSEWKYVYLAKQARILWNLLEQNSVLFELFVDDVKLETCIQSRDDLERRHYWQFNVLAFKECINFLLHLVDVEEKMFKDLKSKSYHKDYKKNFGHEAICCHLYKGLKNSFDKYYKNKNNYNSYEELKILISELNRKIDGLKKLYRT